MTAKTEIRAALAQRTIGHLNGACTHKNISALLADLDAQQAKIDALQADAERFEWYFGDCPKGDWMCTYLDGMKTGWTTDEWRAAIDLAIDRSKQRGWMRQWLCSRNPS